MTVEVRDDMTAESREDFTVSVEVDSGSTSIVAPGRPPNLDFSIPMLLQDLPRFPIVIRSHCWVRLVFVYGGLIAEDKG